MSLSTASCSRTMLLGASITGRVRSGGSGLVGHKHPHAIGGHSSRRHVGVIHVGGVAAPADVAPHAEVPVNLQAVAAQTSPMRFSTGCHRRLRFSRCPRARHSPAPSMGARLAQGRDQLRLIIVIVIGWSRHSVSSGRLRSELLIITVPFRHRCSRRSRRMRSAAAMVSSGMKVDVSPHRHRSRNPKGAPSRSSALPTRERLSLAGANGGQHLFSTRLPCRTWQVAVGSCCTAERLKGPAIWA